MGRIAEARNRHQDVYNTYDSMTGNFDHLIEQGISVLIGPVLCRELTTHILGKAWSS